jgi:hypothetical protein
MVGPRSAALRQVDEGVELDSSITLGVLAADDADAKIRVCQCAPAITISIDRTTTRVQRVLAIYEHQRDTRLV